MQVLDVDTHVIETERVWGYLPSKDEQYTPSILVKDSGTPISAHFATKTTREFWVIDNFLYGKHDVEAIASASNGELTPQALTLEDVSQRLTHMDQQGVDIQVLFSSLFLNLRIAGREAELALTRAYNRWLAECCQASNGRLRWIMVPSLKNPSETVEDMAWARKNGAVGLLFRGIEGDRFLDHQDFDAIYAGAQDLDLPICVHIGHGSPAFESIERRNNSEFNRFISDSPNYFAFSTLLKSDLRTLFPELRFGFFESGSSWIVSNVQTSLHVRLAPKDLMALVQEKMAESRVYVTCELHEDLPSITQYTGTSHLILGSDYGHPGDVADTIFYRQRLDDRTDIEASLKTKLVRDNCHSLFRL